MKYIYLLSLSVAKKGNTANLFSKLEHDLLTHNYERISHMTVCVNKPNCKFKYSTSK